MSILFKNNLSHLRKTRDPASKPGSPRAARRVPRGRNLQSHKPLAAHRMGRGLLRLGFRPLHPTLKSLNRNNNNINVSVFLPTRFLPSHHVSPHPTLALPAPSRSLVAGRALSASVLSREYYKSPRALKKSDDFDSKKSSRGWTPLHRAVLESQFSALQSAVSPAAIAARTPSGRTALHLALSLGPKISMKTVEFLVNSGADVNASDENGWTPLHEAVAGGAPPRALGILLQHGAFPMALTKQGYTPLSLLMNYEPTAEQVETLLTYGADVNASVEPNGLAPLHEGIRAGVSLAVIEALLRSGADPNASDALRHTALSYAVAASDPEERSRLVRRLRESGARSEEKDPLHVSTSRERAHLKKVDSSSREEIRSEPFDLSSDRGEASREKLPEGTVPAVPAVPPLSTTPLSHETIPPLVSAFSAIDGARGADSSSANHHQGIPPESPETLPPPPPSCPPGPSTLAPKQSPSEDSSSIQNSAPLRDRGTSSATRSLESSPIHAAIRENASLTELLRAGADPNAPLDGLTPLSRCCASPRAPGQLERVLDLLRFGARASLADAKGWTPLHAGIQRGAPIEMIRALLEKGGADPNRVNLNGSTPLTLALLARADVETLELLLDFGGNPNASMSGGWSALHHAVKSEFPARVIARLLQAGADARAKDPSGRTPLLEACARARLKIGTILLLLDAGADPNEPDQHGLTPLLGALQASGSEGPEVIRELLRRGADVNLRARRRGATPLQTALERGASLENVRALLEAGGKTNYTHTLSLVLTLASESSPPGDPTELVRLLLELDPPNRHVLRAARALAQRVQSPRAVVALLQGAEGKET